MLHPIRLQLLAPKESQNRCHAKTIYVRVFSLPGLIESWRGLGSIS